MQDVSSNPTDIADDLDNAAAPPSPSDISPMPDGVGPTLVVEAETCMTFPTSQPGEGLRRKLVELLGPDADLDAAAMCDATLMDLCDTLR